MILRFASVSLAIAEGKPGGIQQEKGKGKESRHICRNQRSNISKEVQVQ